MDNAGNIRVRVEVKRAIHFNKGDNQMSLKVEHLDLQRADISGSKWQEVRAEELDIDNVSLAKTKINNANMSGITLFDVNLSGLSISDANLTGMSIDGAQWGGAHFKHIGYGNKDQLENGHTAANPPVQITSCNLEDAVVRETNLRGVSIEGCDIEGLTINGVDISALLRQHKVELS